MPDNHNIIAASGIQQLIDKEAIRDCLLRYSRGVDRHDRKLMLSAYHPDAFDDHGVSSGDPATFVDWALNYHQTYQIRHQHRITNVTIDLDGDTAHVESYYCFWGENREGPPTLAFGRYVDQFERRDGAWAIAYRVCINEITGSFTQREMTDDYKRIFYASGPSTRDRGDASYERPLLSRKAA
jgi:ketosteroid isomerase-like protein